MAEQEQTLQSDVHRLKHWWQPNEPKTNLQKHIRAFYDHVRRGIEYDRRRQNVRSK